MLVLGIESSCDDTSVAILNDQKELLTLITKSQLKEHQPFGGVVPEIAARSHMSVSSMVEAALIQAKLKLKDIDAFAATGGPGLIGGVIVGVMTAKALASSTRKPFIAVNHLEGHALTVRLTSNIDYPYLALLVSGGHCQLLEVLGLGQYIQLGSTLDDAVGEAFDKVARLLGLGYPGGPAVEKLAKSGNEEVYDFPRPLIHQQNCNFSFSGLKTAVKRIVDQNAPINSADVCASFQKAIADVLCAKVRHALSISRGHTNFVLVGGVAANLYIRARLNSTLESLGVRLHAPPISLCTDNAAMIAWVGMERLLLNMTDGLDFEPRPRWPLV